MAKKEIAVKNYDAEAFIEGLKKRGIEESFGWSKIIGSLAQLKVRGLAKVKAVFTFGVVACNLVRSPKLLRTTGELCLVAER